MSEDVQMHSPPAAEIIVVDDSRPPSPPHQERSPVARDASATPSDKLSVTPAPDNGASFSTDSLQVVDDDRIAPVKEKKKIKPTTLKPASTVGAKPKSKARSPSPSPPPPPTRPPLETIRLDIQLGGPEHYEVDVSKLSKELGQRPATPSPIKHDTSEESEGDDEGDGKPKEKRRKRKKEADYYDTSDPFIDDSGLAQEERTFFAQTKQQGFYVSSGQVQLLDVKPPPKKPKSKKINILKPAASVATALSAASLPTSLAPLSLNAPLTRPETVQAVAKEEGTSAAPITVPDLDEGPSNGVKRKFDLPTEDASPSPGTSVNGQTKKKRKTVEIRPFHPEVEAGLQQLREAVAKENWETKGKFPASLKPLLAQVALKAVILGEYDDNFFNVMPKIFPYNKYTMTKLIKRTICKDHIALLQERQNAILEELRVMVEEGFPKAKEEWEKSVIAWEKRQEKAKADAAGGGQPPPSAEGTPSAQDTPPLPGVALPPREEGGQDVSMEHEEGAQGPPGAGKGVSKDAHPPAKRYKLTDRMKEKIWDLVCLSNEMCRIENEKNTLEGSNAVVSDQGARKVLYQKIVSVFPEGWLTTGQISRDVSVIKKKSEKEGEE